MSSIITGFHYDLGGRDVYEDRVRAETFTTPVGMELSVAAVADGVGGRDRGERAAQIALDTVFQILRQSSQTDIPRLLTRAVAEANRAIFREGQRHPDRFRDASTTLSVAVIVDRTRLFIANVGDSRVYFCREGRLTQLTMDHTFENLMPLRGIMNWEAAAADRRAGVIMRALGPREQVQVDLGFYVRTRDPSVAGPRGQKGIPLRQGDAILVCSDGLIKERSGGDPYVTEEEISRVLMSQEGDRAARTLVSFALGRDANDNVSVAILQTPDPARLQRTEESGESRWRRLLLLTGGVAAVLILLLVAAFSFFFQANEETSARATVEAAALSGEQTRLFATATAEIAGVTADALLVATDEAATLTSMPPTPTKQATLTPTPFLILDGEQVAVAFSGDERWAVKEREIIQADELPLQLQINHTVRANFRDASLYAFPGTEIQLGLIEDDRAQLTVFSGSELLVSAGGYLQGVELLLNPDTAISVFIVGSCLGLDYPENRSGVSLSCFGGSCGYFIEAQQVALLEGEQVVLDVEDPSEATPFPIPEETQNRFKQLLQKSNEDSGLTADEPACFLD